MYIVYLFTTRCYKVFCWLKSIKYKNYMSFPIHRYSTISMQLIPYSCWSFEAFINLLAKSTFNAKYYSRNCNSYRHKLKFITRNGNFSIIKSIIFCYSKYLFCMDIIYHSKMKYKCSKIIRISHGTCNCSTSWYINICYSMIS